MTRTIFKLLTKNDLGLTGSHQAGLCVPKELANGDFFPKLDPAEFNPRMELLFWFRETPKYFNYIYYNNKIFNYGTRNEYRLTKMTQFLREIGATVGDSLKFTYIEHEDKYTIDIIRKDTTVFDTLNEDKPLVIYANWMY